MTAGRGCDYSPHRTAPGNTGPTPDRSVPVLGRKLLIISLWRRIKRRNTS